MELGEEGASLELRAGICRPRLFSFFFAFVSERKKSKH